MKNNKSEPDALVTVGQESGSICHGLTRNYTESKTLLSEPEALATVATLRRRIQLFIAYLYKPEAQAKVLQIHVYYSHIIPSLALQACKTRDTLRVGFHIRSSL